MVNVGFRLSCSHSLSLHNLEMPNQKTDNLPTFFVRSVTFDLERLLLVLEDGTGNQLLELSFAPPRAYRVYAESDNWQYLNEFTGCPLVQSADPGCGVELSSNAPYLHEYRANMRAQEPEKTFSCLIRTPDHCVEVICFEQPAVRLL
ncbi:hypothetical protein [Sphingomonas xinjiangensis]|uniref:Uncharacterized protein n=1 Tax=Sphingomonas xinjiangensis TaxID=643568 RepID=A0A840YSW2_9SPHN|nr:hypothetical protein [Sphingomonas xinjiangensis]MBB5712791.1 hypothetical protein [Sphingomonas xinjiangensis]